MSAKSDGGPSASKQREKASSGRRAIADHIRLLLWKIVLGKRIGGLVTNPMPIVWFLIILAQIVVANFDVPGAPLGSFRRIFVCGGHSSAKTPVTRALSGLAPRVRTRVFADGVQDTEHVPLGLLAAGQGGGGHHGRLIQLHFKISRDPTLMICGAVA
ncbi:hypothetical protein [Paracoccus litorisediminis]|uniref:Uncharacterized protein n=1 Tax=Paracoccus litorisediminis TaxID=2006130 RepID=A0A844HLQ0_9RHOB|nr:hypothetical protein [Paracoccus litorisediminis]MTH59999.1 hypothetical protein [Paracoccus litorisediminis]